MRKEQFIRYMLVGALLGTTAMTQPAVAELTDSPALVTLVQQARDLVEADKPGDAEKLYVKYLEANAADGTAHYRMAEFYLDLGAALAAQTQVEKARQKGVTEAESTLLMAKAYLAQQKYTEATRELDSNTIAADQLYDALVVRGDIKMGRKDFDGAIVHFSEAANIDAEAFNAFLGLSNAYLQQGMAEKSRGYIDQALAKGGDQSGVHFAAGLLSKLEGNMDTAISHFATAIELNERSIKARLERASLLVDTGKLEEAQKDLDVVYNYLPDNQVANYISAVILSRQGDFAASEKMLQAAHDMVETFLPAQVTKGFVSYQLGNFSTAITYLSRVLDSVPQHKQARMVLAASQLRVGRPQDAMITMAPFESAEGPLDANVASLIGTIYMNAGDAAKGTKYLTLAAQAQPGNEEVLTRLAIGQHAIGEDDAAVAGLENVTAGDGSNVQAAVLLALIERGRGNYPAARKAADLILSSNPDDPVGHNIMGVIDLGEKKYADAKARFVKALELNSSYAAARRNLADIYDMEGDQAGAERELRRVLGDRRDDVRAIVAMARIKVKQKKMDSAVDFARQAVTLKSDAPRLRFLLADTLLATNQLDDALAVMLKAEKDFPSSNLIGRKLGQIQLLSKDYDSAVGTYARMLDRSPDDLALYREYAMALMKAGFSERSRLMLLRGQDMAKEKNLSTLGFLADLIAIEKSLGNYQAALLYATDLEKLYPDAEVSGVAMGEIHIANKQYDKAAAAFRQAIGKGMDNTKVRVGLATALQLSGDLEGAKAALTEWIAENPDDALSRVALGDLYLGSNDYANSITQYEKILEDGHENPIIMNNLAWAYMKAGDKRALAMGERAYTLGQRRAEFADTLGYIYLTMENDPRRASNLFDEAVRKRPQKALYHYHYGVALMDVGRTKEALNALVKATDMSQAFDGYDDARTRITTLREQAE